MSLRWHLYGVDLSKLWAKLGSGDAALLAALVAAFDYDVRSFDKPAHAAAYRADIAALLTRAIHDGAPFPELRDEHDAHVDVSDHLARWDQAALETDSWDWKHGAWYDLDEQLAPRLAAADRQLLTWLVHGRPIFGQQFDTDEGWRFYTYLTNAEARQLRAALTAAAAGSVGRFSARRNLQAELIGWLDDIVGRELDVWVRAE